MCKWDTSLQHFSPTRTHSHTLAWIKVHTCQSGMQVLQFDLSLKKGSTPGRFSRCKRIYRTFCKMMSSKVQEVDMRMSENEGPLQMCISSLIAQLKATPKMVPTQEQILRFTKHGVKPRPARSMPCLSLGSTAEQSPPLAGSPQHTRVPSRRT